MAKVRIVPKEDMEVLNKYLSGEDAIVLIPEEFAKDHDIEHLDGTTNNYYSYTGEPDLFVDIVNHDEHTFMNYLNSEKEE
ncbi:hypothetical protein [Parageobacillus galactosidasius]|uniref:Uncharacterized protein n=1 Tax=Parageobacillus galactosidasius TaxID=883812 RepID=A0A226QQY4_9BACL|nr:hypothetical protein [Parageobacillus galactosidasius]OXB94881.1 hypothetical protein B9L23_08440 [Parageobacillus galactosidasius]